MRTLIKNAPKNALEKIQLLVNAGNIAQENEKIIDPLHKPANDVLHSRLLAATLMKQAPLYAEIIRQGCDEGIFKTEVPLECAEFILSAIQFLTDKGIYPWTKDDLRRRIQAFPTLIEQILQAPPGCFQFLKRKTRRRWNASFLNLLCYNGCRNRIVTLRINRYDVISIGDILRSIVILIL